jgi:hypothetical protein
MVIGDPRWLAHRRPMQMTSPPRTDRHIVNLVSGTLVGSVLVAAGMILAFLVIATPLVSTLALASRGGTHMTIAMFVWALSLILGGALLVAGTNRLAATVASVRSHTTRLTPLLRALGHLPDEVVVATGAIPHDGIRAGELLVGPFGVAIVHAMPHASLLRRVGQTWEGRTRSGHWIPAESPLDGASREADRIRHWLTTGDLDFVVRVYTALVSIDPTVVRTSSCAVITPDQIPAWIEALPRQRSLTASRRSHLLARIHGDALDGESRSR